MHTLPGHYEPVKALNRKLKNVLFEETEPFLNEIMGVAMLPNEAIFRDIDRRETESSTAECGDIGGIQTDRGIHANCAYVKKIKVWLSRFSAYQSPCRSTASKGDNNVEIPL